MIVILGRPGLREGTGTTPDALWGWAARSAVAAAGSGARVELVGSIGDDTAGDRVVVLLSEAGVGHAALLRDPAGATHVVGRAGGPVPRLDAADVELGLRYVPECRVLVLADELAPAAVDAALGGAAYHGAAVIALVPDGAAPPPNLPDVATVLAMPRPDETDANEPGLSDREMPDPRTHAAFAGLVGSYAAAIDAGRPPAEAFAVARASVGWEAVGEG